MLTVLPAFSQDDTDKPLSLVPVESLKPGEKLVCIPFGVARLIALDLVEKDRLQAVNLVIGQKMEKLEELNESQGKIIVNQQLQNDLLEENNSSLKTELKAEREKKDGGGVWKWVLRCLGAAAAGFVIGSLSN